MSVVSETRSGRSSSEWLSTHAASVDGARRVVGREGTELVGDLLEVRNLLTLARFDEGALRLLRMPTDLHDRAVEAADSLSRLAEESNVTVEVSGQSAMVNADVEYLRLVFTNLLENAIKYSGPGAHVEVTSQIEGSEALLIVADTGPGMSTQASDRVFDRFYRIDSARSKELGGSGLGLAITKEIVEAHGGRIELHSEVGKGSRFAVRLPLG
jgi:signal transduction histidine kinase